MVSVMRFPVSRQRRKEKHKHKRLVDDNLSTDELMETATFKKFYSLMDNILENAEDLDLGALNGKHKCHLACLSVKSCFIVSSTKHLNNFHNFWSTI